MDGVTSRALVLTASFLVAYPVSDTGLCLAQLELHRVPSFFIDTKLDIFKTISPPLNSAVIGGEVCQSTV